ncbi:hypothetical protein [Sphaerisporangium fuscum]|uniref:hypothetical protein n=1 Tax=Sphaerisporangium fuscum TaxID=2835868 RepID=UPI001BDD501C|nr:hypothetical protein [Sphaerisporangium fuscum]
MLDASVADLLARVRHDLTWVGFPVCDEADRRGGLEVFEVRGGVGIRWRSSYYPAGLPAGGAEAGVSAAQPSLSAAVHLAVAWVLVQAGHAVARHPGTGDIVVLMFTWE